MVAALFIVTAFAAVNNATDTSDHDGYDDFDLNDFLGKAGYTILEVAAGADHSLFLKNDGTVWSWGRNTDGQLGDGTVANKSMPVQVMLDSTTPLTGVTAVAAGANHSMALKGDGTVWAWGRNSEGQLGDGTSGPGTNKSTPVQVMVNGTTPLAGVTAIAAGGSYSMALKSSGTAWAWGDNGYGQLGDGTTVSKSRPVQVMLDSTTPLTGVTAVSAGGAHSIALKSDGTVWSWGWNNVGQLGDGSTVAIKSSPVQVMLNTTTPLTGVTAVSAGGAHTLAISNTGTVWSWGYNGYGQLGDGTAGSKSRPVQVMLDAVNPLTGVTAVSAGNYYSLALKGDGTVWSWGYNEYGQLGDGTAADKSRPAEAFISGVAAVSAGANHSMALRNDGTLWAWGYNFYGQLGDGTSGIAADKNVPTQVLNPSGVTAISAGWGHSMVLKSDGTVWAWGYNYYGQLGDGTIVDKSVPVQVMLNSTTPLTGVTAVAAGYYHSLALKSDGTVWAWGYNIYGQLGDGTSGSTTNKSRPVQVMLDSTTPLTGVTAISGGEHSLALKSDGTVWAWGYNLYGQLGDGTGGSATNKSSPVQSLMPVEPTIATSSLSAAATGTPYSQTLTAIGTTPITWSVESGSLPAGLDLNGTTGVISGTPSVGGTFEFTVKASNIAGNDTKILSITIPAMPTVTTASLIGGITGTPYSQTLTATGTAQITWSVESGNLPAGLSLNGTTGVISGTPTATGVFGFTVKASNSVGSVTKMLSITVTAAAVAPAISTPSLQGGVTGISYSQTLTATGTTPMVWSVVGGSLPAGLDLNGTTGTISGTPSALGTFTFTVKAENGAGSDTKVLSITVTATAVAPVIATSSLPGCVAGTAYSQTLAVTGSAPITWSVVSGSLPAGLELNGTTGTISGTPTAAGTSEFTVKAENGAGSDTKVLYITVTAAGGGEPKGGDDGGGGGMNIMLIVAVVAIIAIAAVAVYFFILKKK